MGWVLFVGCYCWLSFGICDLWLVVDRFGFAVWLSWVFGVGGLWVVWWLVCLFVVFDVFGVGAVFGDLSWGGFGFRCFV